MSRRIFLSYSHDDLGELEPIRFMLNELRRDDRAVTFDDAQIGPGRVFDAEIDNALRSATHILLAISNSFIESTYVSEKELPAIKHISNSGRAKLFPLIIQGHSWQMLMECDRGSFIKSYQYWPLIKGRPTPFSQLKENEKIDYVKQLRLSILLHGSEDHRGLPVDDRHWWRRNFDTEAGLSELRHILACLDIASSVDVRVIDPWLPRHLSQSIERQKLPDLIDKSNNILFDVDRVNFKKRKIAEFSENILEEDYWSDTLLEMSECSPLSIVTILSLIYYKCPEVESSIEAIINSENEGRSI